MAAPGQSLEDRLRIIERLLNAFRLDRYIYLGITVATFVALVVYLCVLIRSGTPSATELMLLVGPSGVISLLTLRVLRMWDDAIKIVFKLDIERQKEEK
jgi:hypothetical protein